VKESRLSARRIENVEETVYEFPSELEMYASELGKKVVLSTKGLRC
jgi:hypothetical protein